MAAIILLLFAPANAQETPATDNQPPTTVEVTPAKDTSVTVSPTGCDFDITFPDEPYTSKRCPEEAGGQCYDLSRYTMVYHMSTTVDVRFSCNALKPGQFEQYSEPVTRMALNGMAARNDVRQSTTQFSQENDVKRTTLSGSGVTGRQNKIYVAQIWLTPRSILTLEAELIGPEHPEADAVFSDILKSVAVKQAQAPKTDSAPAPAQP